MRKVLMFVGIGTLSLLMGLTAAYAQDEPKKEEPKQEEPKRQDEAKPPKHEEMKPPKQENEKMPKQEEHNRSQAAQEQGHGDKHMAKGQGGHIPDAKFHSNFGRQHTFVVNHPTVVEGQPRFQYSGYWFVISDSWPAEWAYTDDCYIDYIDGEYFLFDLLHPGVRIALVVVMD